MDALRSFQPAFRMKQLDVRRGEFDTSLFVHVDTPLGEPRFTYARTRGKKVVALVIFTMAEQIDGVPCFGLGYAVPEDERGRGLAADLVTAAIAELRHGLRRNGLADFWVEAVVGRDNIASQKVAAAILGGPGQESADAISGEPVYVFARRFWDGELG